jgi:hypothetical protein
MPIGAETSRAPPSPNVKHGQRDPSERDEETEDTAPPVKAQHRSDDQNDSGDEPNHQMDIPRLGHSIMKPNIPERFTRLALLGALSAWLITCDCRPRRDGQRRRSRRDRRKARFGR